MNPTASKLALLERCAPAAALPAVWTDATDDMRAGTARHRFIQRAREVGREEALAEVPADAPWRAQCEALDLDELPRGDHEIAYAYDVATDTARCLGPWLDRAYEVSATEISGTADLIAPPTAEHPRWLVIDFKGEEEVEPAGVNLQLGLFALCLARLHGVDEVDVAIGYLGHGAARGIRWDRATLGPFDLEAVAARLAGIAGAITAARAVVAAGGTPDVTMGLHCRRCPALLCCPAQAAAARALLAAPPANDALAQASAEEAGAAWVQVKVFGELVDRMRAVLAARAEVAGLPLPDGTRLVPVEVLRRSLVLDKAEPVLRAKFGDQVDSFIERSLSNEIVTKLARQLAPGGKGIKRATEDLWGALGAAGAVKRSTHTQLRVKAAKGGAEAEEGAEP